jgi:hypothetical protein
MTVPKWIKPFYIVASLYDGILGLLFLIVPTQLFDMTRIPPPNHIGYVQFPSMLLVVFAIMFWKIARNPSRNKNLIIYGILLKVSYCSVVLSHWLVGNIPIIWVPFAVFDLCFMIGFIAALKQIKTSK